MFNFIFCYRCIYLACLKIPASLWTIFVSFFFVDHTTPDEFENGIFTLKTHRMISVLTTEKKFESAATSSVILYLCLSKNRVGEYHDYHNDIGFDKVRFQNVYRPR